MGYIEVVTQTSGPTRTRREGVDGIEVRKPDNREEATIKGNVARTYSPPLHLRNTEREPFIFSGLRLLGRYCEKKQDK